MPRRWLDPALFSDEKLAKATIPERLLFACMVANQDDDGRLLGHPGYLRSIAFPYDDFSVQDVKQMRDHLTTVNPNIILYNNEGNEYIQLRRHKRYQKPRYYHPSKLPTPPGWPFQEQQLDGNHTDTAQPLLSTTMVTKQYTEGRVGLDKGKNLDLDKGQERDGETPPPSLAGQPLEKVLTDTFPLAFGNPPNSRQLAQLRDLGKEISAAGGAPGQKVVDAFKEAAFQNKPHVSYVRAVLLDWLGIPRDRSP